ncbi:MAG: hypothetical protein E7013_04215 [Alphaproteobacteria bacterium]|nr:hypothetical protein [Alphaproteobacteria bacterium]
MAFSFPLRSEKESFRNPIFNQTLESSFGQFKVSPPSSYFVREDVQPFDLKCQLIKDDEFEIILNCPEKDTTDYYIRWVILGPIFSQKKASETQCILKEYTAKTLKNVYDNYATTHPHYTNLLQDGGCGLSKKEISTKWGQLN